MKLIIKKNINKKIVNTLNPSSIPISLVTFPKGKVTSIKNEIILALLIFIKINFRNKKIIYSF